MANEGDSEVVATSNVDHDVDESEDTVSPMSSPGKPKQMLGLGLADQLNGLNIDSAEFKRNLPECVRRRIRACKKLMIEQSKLEVGFYEELHNLEKKYLDKYTPLFDRRLNIISGEVEPTDSECDYVTEDEDDEEENKDGGPEAGDTKRPNLVNSNMASDVKGIPDFWLNALKHCEELGALIESHDEPILAYLEDVKADMVEAADNKFALIIEFHFRENEFFTNKILSRKFIAVSELEENELMCDGPEPSYSEGCEIDWKPNKNVTVKVTKKKQKNKKSGVQRTVKATVSQDSFFHFFDVIPVEDQTDEENEEAASRVQQDHELANFIREGFIPRAVLYYTGEAPTESASDFDFDEDDDDDEEDEDDDDESPLAGGRGGPPFARGRGGGAAAHNGGEKPECKQQ